jgi:hypothetical protein
MSLAGKGAVAIWHDIAPEGRNAFYAWHGHEHMPERAGIPGFLRGRRYVGVQGTPEFFNLYETVSRFTVTGADYLGRLNAPTPWTVATIRHFRNVARSLCEVAASFGDGQGVWSRRCATTSMRQAPPTIASASPRKRSRRSPRRAAWPAVTC